MSDRGPFEVLTWMTAHAMALADSVRFSHLLSGGVGAAHAHTSDSIPPRMPMVRAL